MKTKKTILTNIVDYTFDKIAFDMDFRLIRVQLQDNSEQSQFQQIVQRIDVIAMTNLSSSMCYLLMVRRGTSVTELEKSNLVFEIIRLGNLPDNVYENQVFQLLLNQESALENSQPEKNKSPHLLISLNDWVNKPKRTNDWKQRYALRVGLNWESDLDLKVQTYTHFPKSKETDELFYWNSERRNLQKSFMHKESVLFRYKNGTGRNSTVAFLNLEQIEKFEVSKVGVAWILLTNVSKHFGKYFEQLPKYLGSEVLQFDKQKLDNKAAIWRQFKGEIINIYYDSNEPLTKVLALEISHALQDSGILNDYGIQIKLSDKSSSGFNIQIIRDARDTGNISDAYEVGDSQRYIQHATIENFGGFDKRTNALNWQLDQTGKVDAANDDTLVKLAQELIIKRDLANRDASIISLPLVKKTCDYKFYRIEWIQQSPLIVVVIQFTIDAFRHIKLTKRVVNFDEFDADDEFSQLAFKVKNSLNSTQDKRFLWQQIDCIISRGDDLIMIQQTPRRTMPNGELLSQKLGLSDPYQPLLQAEVIEALKTLFDSHAGQKLYQGTVQNLIQIISSMDDSNPDLGDIKKGIKKKEITFKNKILQTIDNDLEETAGFTFSSSVRQKTNSAMLEGLQGIGLTKIANDFYYYVGSDKALKLSVNRAVMLRKLVVLDGDDSAVEKEFPDFSKMMSVEFVRNGQYTVLPYPVKYLREFWNYEQRIYPIDPAKFE